MYVQAVFKKCRECRALPRARRVAFALAALATAMNAYGAEVGGWNMARGGWSALITGEGMGSLRADLATYFPSTGLHEAPGLTPEFLADLDAVILSVVYDPENVPITPLAPDEQAALVAFVAAGGRALLITDNAFFQTAGNSVVEPFGLHVADAFLPGDRDATISDHTGCPAITDGLFGSVTSFRGRWISYFDDTGTAAVLGRWDTNQEPALAVLNPGGRVIFSSEEAVVRLTGVLQNDALRRNMLAFLLLRAADLNCDGEVNFGDINPFVLLLSNPAVWEESYPGCPQNNGDINCDGGVSFGDINPFVACLTTGDCGCP